MQGAHVIKLAAEPAWDGDIASRQHCCQPGRRQWPQEAHSVRQVVRTRAPTCHNHRWASGKCPSLPPPCSPFPSTLLSASCHQLSPQARVGETGGSQRTPRQVRLGLAPAADSAARPGLALAPASQQAWLELGSGAGMAAVGEALAAAGRSWRRAGNERHESAVINSPASSTTHISTAAS